MTVGEFKEWLIENNVSDDTAIAINDGDEYSYATLSEYKLHLSDCVNILIIGDIE